MTEQNTYSGTSLHIYNLVQPDMTIRNTTFDNCEIRGPAVLLFDGIEFSGAHTAPANLDSFLIEIEYRSVIPAGMILLLECVFRSCTFINITIAGTPNQIAVLREDFV